MTLPRITLSPTAPRRKTPPQTAKWRELTLAALRKIGRKGNRAPNSDAGGESWPKMTSCPACGAMISVNATACPRCGAVFSRTLVTVGLAIMLAIAVLYSLLQRYL
jgi:hypothetical protein